MTVLSNLQLWWQGRNARERVMLSVMLAAVAAFVAWYGVFAPLRQARDAARARYDRSVSDLRQVQASAGLQAAEQRRRPAQDRDQSTSLVLQSAAAAGLAVSRQRSDPSGGLVLGMDAVAAPTLFAWLDALQAEHGLAPYSLQVERSGADVRAEITFRIVAP